jgi:hypothetical protein
MKEKNCALAHPLELAFNPWIMADRLDLPGVFLVILWLCPAHWNCHTHNRGVAQAGTVIRLELATPQVNVGDVFDVAIRIDNVTNLAGADVQLQFNPALLQVQDADPGKEGTQIRPGNFPVPNFIATNVVTNTTGQIQYAAIQFPPPACQR